MKFCLFFLVFFTVTYFSFSQTNYPVITNERGDTVLYKFPPPDSCFVKDHIVVRFRPNALNLNLLCYGNNNNTINSKNNDKVASLTPAERSLLMSQKFYVDDLIVDTNFRNAIKYFGGDSISRLTWANPCTDTISIARSGDTISCDDYLWMILEFNNDTSVVSACYYLTYYFHSQIIGAEPDYFIKLLRTPNDGYFATNQKSLHSDEIGMEAAWQSEVGNYDIKIAVIDNGIYWMNCDFGGNFGPGCKVSDGLNLEDYSSNINYGWHGTMVAGIIGALTNRTCATEQNSIAGIAGGWGVDPELGLGCQLLGFSCRRREGDTTLWLSQAVAAIKVASSFNPQDDYAYGVNIINISWIVTQLYVPTQVTISGIYVEYLRAAINYAFENCVSIVCARGNDGNTKPQYPACYDASWITSVGCSDIDKTKHSNSSYGEQMDVIAPFGNPTQNRVYSTEDVASSWDDFNGTSASASHVTGVIGLLQSYALNHNWNTSAFYTEPEDYEGMIKASAHDIPYQQSTPYLDGYDIPSGWGHLQADNIFQMLNDGYELSHFSAIDLTYGNWEPNNIDKLDYAFLNSGRRNKPIPADYKNNYKVRVRECTGNIVLTSNYWMIDNDNKLYVWGRSNRDGLGGFSKANPNYQTNFTRITSGTGSNPTETDGIIHNQSLTVTAKTYQYDVWDKDGNYLGLFPPNNKLALNISAFGRKIPLSVKLSDNISSELNLNIIPNPVNENCTIEFFLEGPSNIFISIVDIFGNTIYNSQKEYLNSGQYSQKADINKFSNGLYFCKLFIDNRLITKSFIVSK